MKRFLPYIFLVSIFFASKLSYAQDFTLIVEMVITDDGKVMSGANVNVFRDGQFVEKVTSDNKGRVDVALKPGGIYEITIGGNFYIKKKLQVNTKNVPPEDLSGETYFPAEVNIFKKIEGMDYSILEKPIGKIEYNPSLGAFDVDMEYTKSMKSRLQKLQEDYLAQKKKEEEQLAQKKNDYDKAIKIADKAFKDKNWLEAEKYYKEAADLMPMETYPSFQLAELESKVLKSKQQEEKYNTAIQIADKAFEEKNYQKAKAEYKNAVNIKPGDEYAQNRMQEAQDLLANAARVEQNYLAAIEKGDNALKVNQLETAKTAFEEAAKLKPDETYPQNKLAEIKSVLAKQNAKEEEYQQALKMADEALASKNYKTAKSEYEKAANLKPAESYPKDQIAKVEGLMAEAAKVEQNYLAAVEKGDNALAANDYEGAKSAFQEASKIKPNEEYPKNKIQEIDGFLAKQQAKEEEYQNKIKEADQLLAKKNYESAKSTYETAAKLKPQESYPKEKIGEIETTLAQLAEKEENYKAAVAKGDKALAVEDYEAAKAAYNEALAIKSEESYPKEKLSEIETIVLKIEQADEEYNKAIADGDKALDNKEYEKSMGYYKQAASLKSGEQYPKDQIAKIETKLAELKANEKAYTSAIDEGDAAKGKGDLETAVSSYEKALSLKPDATYPQQQITEIKEKLAAQKAKEEKYQQAIAKGDQALSTEDYQTAKAAYEEALTIKDEDYPRKKLGEIERVLAQQQEKEAAYLASIEKGDAALQKENWEEAKSAYEEALKIKKAEYPQNKIDEINNKLEEIAAAEEAAAKLEADYQAAISEGDQKLASAELEAAKAAYEKAMSLKSDEEYPKTKIGEIVAELQKQAEEAAEQKRLAALEKEYKALIAKADQAFASDDLEAARKSYQEALAIKSEEEYPQAKIEEINATLADAAQQEKAYQDAIAAADALLNEEKLEVAKKKYAEAASIKSNEQYPKGKIKEIEDKLAELAAQQQEIRLKQEQKAKQEAKYKALVAEADAMLEDQKLEEAKSKYQEALAIKNETYPQNKIKEIDNKLAALESKKLAEQKAAEQAKREAKFQALIAEGDALLAKGELEEAKDKFIDAIGIKEDPYPANKIAEIDDRMDKLATEAAKKERLAKLEADYQSAIQSGDANLSNKNYQKAIEAYRKAMDLKPEETYPQAKIEEAQAALQAQSQKQTAYQETIVKADALMEEEKYEAAISSYQAALKIKNDPYPRSQIQKAKDAIELLATKQEEEAKKVAAYQAAIAKADQLFTDKSFEKAIAEYEKAKGLKPSKPYPQDQIDRINELLSSRAEKLAAAEAKKQKAAEIEAKYKEALAKADQAFESKQLILAKREYNKAIQLKPDENYPKIQLDKVESELEAQRLADLEKREKDEEIKIQKGPKSTIDGDAEAEIDQMYEEIWAERQAKKKELIEEKEAAVAKYSDNKREEEEKKRRNALERIEGISVSLSEQNKEATELHLQNYESIRQKEKAQSNFYQEKKRDSERKRNDVYADAERKAENRQKDIQQKVEEKYDGLKEDVEKQYETQLQAEQKRRSEQRELSEANQKDLEAKVERMQKLQKELADNQLMASVQLLKEKKEAWNSSREIYTNSSQERISDMNVELEEKAKKIQEQNHQRNQAYQKGHNELQEKTEAYKNFEKEKVKASQERILDNHTDLEEKAKKIQEQNHQRNQSYQKGHDALQEKTENYKAFEKEKVNASQERIAERQVEINEQIESQQEMSYSKKESYKAGQEAVEEKEKALQEQTQELNAESENRRKDNLDKEYYTGEAKPREDPKAAEYPQGVSEKIIEGENSTTIRRIVVDGTQVDIYEKTLHNYGGVFYTKNGENITKEVWDQESR